MQGWMSTCDARKLISIFLHFIRCDSSFVLRAADIVSHSFDFAGLCSDLWMPKEEQK